MKLTLTPEEVARDAARAIRNLGAECAQGPATEVGE